MAHYSRRPTRVASEAERQEWPMPCPSVVANLLLSHSVSSGETRILLDPSSRLPQEVYDYVLEYLRRNLVARQAERSDVIPFLHAIWPQVLRELRAFGQTDAEGDWTWKTTYTTSSETGSLLAVAADGIVKLSIKRRKSKGASPASAQVLD